MLDLAEAPRGGKTYRVANPNYPEGLLGTTITHPTPVTPHQWSDQGLGHYVQVGDKVVYRNNPLTDVGISAGVWRKRHGEDEA